MGIWDCPMSERLAEVRSQLGGARLIVVTKYADEAQVEALLASVSVTSGRIERSNWRRVERWPEASWHFLGRIQRGTSAISPGRPCSRLRPAGGR